MADEIELEGIPELYPDEYKEHFLKSNWDQLYKPNKVFLKGYVNCNNP